jgi:hypothetical protein
METPRIADEQCLALRLVWCDLAYEVDHQSLVGHFLLGLGWNKAMAAIHFRTGETLPRKHDRSHIEHTPAGRRRVWGGAI